MTGPRRAPSDELIDLLVANEGRSNGFFRAIGFTELIHRELHRHLLPGEHPDFFAPAVFEIDAEPGRTEPGTLRRTVGTLKVGAAVTLQDRVVFMWQEGMIRLRTDSVVIRYDSIRSVDEVTYRAKGDDIAGLEVVTDRRLPVLFTNNGPSMSFWRGLLYLRLTGAAQPDPAGPGKFIVGDPRPDLRPANWPGSLGPVPAGPVPPAPPRPAPPAPTPPAPPAPTPLPARAAPPAHTPPPPPDRIDLSNAAHTPAPRYQGPPPGRPGPARPAAPVRNSGRGPLVLGVITAVTLLLVGGGWALGLIGAAPVGATGAGSPAGDPVACSPQVVPSSVTTSVEFPGSAGPSISFGLTSGCEIDVLLRGDGVLRVFDADGKLAAGAIGVDGLVLPSAGDAFLNVVFPLGAYRAVVGDLDVDPLTATLTAASEPTTSAPAAYGPVLLARPLTAFDPESAARAVLDAQVHQDADEVAAAVDRWAPQLASGRPGVVVDGVVFGYVELLDQHLAVRATDPDYTRLVWSGDWTTFSGADFYVTLIPLYDLTPDAANGWCDRWGYPPEDCFAKYLSVTAGAEGTTAHR